MTISTKALLDVLLRATTSADVKGVLDSIGDSSEIGLDTAFGPFDFQWHSFGNNPSNISTIGLGTKPGRSLTERMTNAIDALLEDRVQPKVGAPHSPRLAAKSWFNRPISGPDDGLFKCNYSDLDIDRRISVVLSPAAKKGTAPIDVIDDGIGIAPDDFSSTILSLQNRNKIQKWYLI